MTLEEMFTLCRERFPGLRGGGWDGCKCGCHALSGEQRMVHVVACCNPSAKELAEIRAFFFAQPGADQLRGDPRLVIMAAMLGFKGILFS